MIIKSNEVFSMNLWKLREWVDFWVVQTAKIVQVEIYRRLNKPIPRHLLLWS
ncbi:hypothetical protein ES703_43520 [subsurface metagenome]